MPVKYRFSDWWVDSGFTVGGTALFCAPLIPFVQGTPPAFKLTLSLIFLYVGLAGIAISQNTHPIARNVLRILGIEAIYRTLMARRLAGTEKRLLKLNDALDHYDREYSRLENATKEQAREFYYALVKRSGVYSLRPFEEVWRDSRSTMSQAAYSKMMWESGAGQAFEEGKADFGAPPVRHEWRGWIYSDLNSVRTETEQQLAGLQELLRPGAAAVQAGSE